VRSLPPERVAKESRRLCADGYREIVVTGIEISSYGRDLSGVTLLDALCAVSDNAPECRIHLSSLEPSVITDELCRELKSLPRLCDHFHLSLQSGCDETLRRMRRHYDTAGFSRAVTALRNYFPNCGVSADLITGFPGETDAEFDATMRFIERCDFSSMHIFPYSERPGTPAAVMEHPVPPQLRRERAAIARALASSMRDRFCDAQIGRTLEVLFERESAGRSFGHAGNYVELSVDAAGVRGLVLPVTVAARGGGVLLA
jgi:threonylcarbamoyladenosine tRNA methylthiotransferase MtaB